MFSPETESALRNLADQLHPDAAPCSEAELAELVLDAGRLGTFGYPDAQAEVDRLIAERGWDAVLAEARRFTYVG